MFFMGEGFVFFIVFASLVSGQFTDCDYYENLFLGIEYNIGISSDSTNTHCRWAAEAPPGYQVAIDCHDIALPWVRFHCNHIILEILRQRDSPVINIF